MPRYTPQSLPMDASRPAASSRQQTDSKRENMPSPPSYIQLAQHIRRERGMQGVRGYVASMRNYLTTSEYQELCKTMGLPLDVQPPEPTHAQRAAQSGPAQPQPSQQQNSAQQMQTLQMLMQLMNAQGGNSAGGNAGAGGGINPNLLASLLGGGQGGGNPDMLTQLLGNMGGGNAGGNQNSINPMLLAQLLNGMNSGK